MIKEIFTHTLSIGGRDYQFKSTQSELENALPWQGISPDGKLVSISKTLAGDISIRDVSECAMFCESGYNRRIPFRYRPIGPFDRIVAVGIASNP